jgi:hypothetical protein
MILRRTSAPIRPASAKNENKNKTIAQAHYCRYLTRTWKVPLQPTVYRDVTPSDRSQRGKALRFDVSVLPRGSAITCDERWQGRGTS